MKFIFFYKKMKEYKIATKVYLKDGKDGYQMLLDCPLLVSFLNLLSNLFQLFLLLFLLFRLMMKMVLFCLHLSRTILLKFQNF
jgi:hypothetical protein